jgi:hypothetical protein
MLALLLTALLTAPACGGDSGEEGTTGDEAGMTGDTADCEYDLVTFKLADGSLVEVSINGLPVEVMSGADKSGADSVTVVERRGVRFLDILEKGGITADDAVPVNCVARDGYDPFRTKLGGDAAKLPTFGFLRDFGYVYVGSPGDKDPLYPEMEGKSLTVDYDLASDAEVPASLGENLTAINMFRWKMLEKVDDQQRGIIELDPKP